MQAEVREQIRQAQDEWNELEGIYKKEARKKKSKFTPEELEVQQELVKKLYAEIEKVKEAQMKGYAKSRTPDAAVALNTKALAFDSTLQKYFLFDRINMQLLTSVNCLLSAHSIWYRWRWWWQSLGRWWWRRRRSRLDWRPTSTNHGFGRARCRIRY